ncbi:MAG: hypothetical protein ACTSQC_01655 [Candidatus Heimdallarchaeaceae archaeon]
MQRIVIVGGSFSGINVANKFAMKTRRKDVSIILIEPEKMLVSFSLNQVKPTSMKHIIYSGVSTMIP